MAKANININKTMQNVIMIVNVSDVKKFKIKLFIATQLLKLSALILGCAIKIETEQP